jgi:antitoxin ParD1/3/4
VVPLYDIYWYEVVAMAKNTSVTLGGHFDDFIAKQLKTGRYGSASEIVRAGLRMLEDSECKLESLRHLLDEGEESGISDYSLDSMITEMDDELNQ